MHRSSRGESGFTLVELLVVVIIIGILAAIAIPRFLDQRARANNAAAVSDLRSLIIVETSLEATTGFTDNKTEIAQEGWKGSNSQIRVCAEVLGADDDDIAITSWHMAGDLQYSWTRSSSVIQSNQAEPMPNDCVSGTKVWPLED